MGARKIWRNCLPRLKYHNPAVSMTVERSDNQSGPSVLTVYYGSRTQPALPVPTISNDEGVSTEDRGSLDKTEVIDMKGKHEREILDDLLGITRARTVESTEEEAAELAQLEEQQRRSGIDRERTTRLVEAEKREKMLLEQARGEM